MRSTPRETQGQRLSAGAERSSPCLVSGHGKKDTGTQSALPGKVATSPTSETFIEHNAAREGQKRSLQQAGSPRALEAREGCGCRRVW